jgi:hypothetical protein
MPAPVTAPVPPSKTSTPEPVVVSPPAAAATPQQSAPPIPDVSPPPPGAAADVDIAKYQAAWPAIAARMRDLAGPSKHALLLEASPATVADGTVTFELPSHLPFHLERLKVDTQLHQLLAQASAEFVGGSLRVDFRAKGDPVADGEHEPERAPEKEDLDEGDEGAIDPTSLIVDMLDGEIIDD